MADESRVIATVKKVMPAVVSIAIAKHLKDLERERPHELYSFLPGHGRAHHNKHAPKIPDFLADKKGMVDVGGGSGFIVDANGLVLTNKHVVSDAKAEYTVIMNDGKKHAATVASRDPINDVAILRIGARGLPAVPFGDSRKLELGQSVIAIGNALGIFKNTVSVGIVSGLSRAVQAQDENEKSPQELRGLIQTDAAINPGNSGGPLVNLEGEAIGVNAALVYDAENIGFAIPIQAAKRDLHDLRAYGHIRRPFLGVRYLLVNDALKDQFNLDVNYGAIVVSESPHDPGVMHESPAAKAGIENGDVILAMNGLRVDTEHSVQDYLDEMAVGETVRLTVRRGGSQFTVSATLTERV